MLWRAGLAIERFAVQAEEWPIKFVIKTKTTTTTTTSTTNAAEEKRGGEENWNGAQGGFLYFTTPPPEASKCVSLGALPFLPLRFPCTAPLRPAEVAFLAFLAFLAPRVVFLLQ